MTLRKILIQLDTDDQPSVFDSVVAVDAGVDQLVRHQALQADQVRDLVYGAMFTRPVEELRNTAIFIGGSDVAAGEVVLAEVCATFFGAMRVSVMLDSNGCNTTAAAAVLVAGRHLELAGTTALVLGGTGPVGARVARLLAGQAARVRVGSRSRTRAEAVCRDVADDVADAAVEARPIESDAALQDALDGVSLVVCTGAPGVQLLSAAARAAASALRVAIDLNAVPPLGIEGIAVTDKGCEYQGVMCFGAVGVGGTKMKIHHAAVAKLFTANDHVLDADAIYDLGRRSLSTSYTGNG